MGIIGICVRVTALLVLVMATSNRCAPIPATTGAAQGQLPPCPADQNVIWTNCFGTDTFASGNKYVGEYRDNNYNGQGTFMFADGIKYVGEYRDDKHHGQGTLTYPNGEKYIGEFRDGKEDGQGTDYLPDGSVGRSGLWRGGQFTPTEHDVSRRGW